MAVAVLLVAACAGVERGPSAQALATPKAPTPNGSASTPGGSASGPLASTEEARAISVTFEELHSDPARFVGTPIKVTGGVFFLASCPPPGASPAPCVLQGYLTDPGRDDLLPGEVGKTIVLAERGNDLSCVEGGRPTVGCGDWENAVRYTVVGVPQYRVLGGRQTDEVQLNALTKLAEGS